MDKFKFAHQAMRIGSTYRKQGYRNEAMTSPDFGCALRAVADAIGAEGDAEAKYSAIKKRFPVLTQIVIHPMTDLVKYDLGSVCASLNDVYHWPREKIADLVQAHEEFNLLQDAINHNQTKLSL